MSGPPPTTFKKYLTKCLDYTLYPLILVCFLPFYLLRDPNRERRRRARLDPYNYDQDGREIFIPSDINLLRLPGRHGLTLAPDYNVAQRKTLEAQNGSALLRKFPREIRNMIWKEAVGGRVIHLWYKEKERRLGHLLCVYHEVGGGKEDWNYLRGCRQLCWNGRRSNTQRILGLLLTCRTIHSEAINYLYSENTFDLASPELLRSLPRLLPAQFLNRITSLRFICRPAGVSPEIWKVLAEMDGLKILRMEFCFDLARNVRLDDDLKAHIADVKKPQIFEVTLPRNIGYDYSIFDGLPCTILRRT